MHQSLSLVSLLVSDYDEAIAFYTGSLGFELKEDSPMGNGKRWVVVNPRGSQGCALLLAKASSPEQLAQVGNQTGGRVFLFLQTDDFWQDYQAMKEKGVQFMEAPREEVYGWVVVFADLYGNKWDLLQRKPMA
ncbi:VOC family protein [Parachitinimonas caeni]|uniref:VOC family protein n=1 Tax=Parachitinimonas caeni TaxID=3031301 RepID=A0ABT7DR03_9NEIS|nr:VOC family protein [Parachitinimonas caeni]MDK2122508.1 VOC family protein [Parachitinimonas caeni]